MNQVPQSPYQDESSKHRARKPAKASIESIVNYFDGKTQAILTRYGPGPRVHYHVGLIEIAPGRADSSEVLRGSLILSQERMLWYAADVWDAPSSLTGNVLDVGCGLGGGAIFWAQEFGAQVTAVTCVSSHVGWVAHFAAQAGVASHINAISCDVLDLPGEDRFDAAVAIDSSGYLPRRPLFRRLASLVRSGGHVFVIDCFLVKKECEDPFNNYWHTRIGRIEEYIAAAEQAGFVPGPIKFLSSRTEHFWSTTIALTKLEQQGRSHLSLEQVRGQSSLRAHAFVRQALVDGGLCYAMMSFSKSI